MQILEKCNCWMDELFSNDDDNDQGYHWRRKQKKKHEKHANHCRPLHRPKKDEDPDNKPWVAFTNPPPKLSRDEVLLKILETLGIKVDPAPIEPISEFKNPITPVVHAMMYTPVSYEENFPPLERRTDSTTKVTARPYVPAKILPLVPNPLLQQKKC